MPGPAIGGSCFPKDTLALLKTAQEYGAPIRIVEAVVAVNDERKQQMAEKIETRIRRRVRARPSRCWASPSSPTPTICATRPAWSSCRICRTKARASGPSIPKAAKEAKKLLKIDLCKDAYDALDGADGVAILTEWNEFRALDLARVKSLLKTPADDRFAQHLPPGTDESCRIRVFQRGTRERKITRSPAIFCGNMAPNWTPATHRE